MGVTPSLEEMPHITGTRLASRWAFTEAKPEPVVPLEMRRELLFEEFTVRLTGVTPSVFRVPIEVGIRLLSLGVEIGMELDDGYVRIGR